MDRIDGMDGNDRMDSLLHQNFTNFVLLFASYHAFYQCNDKNCLWIVL